MKKKLLIVALFALSLNAHAGGNHDSPQPPSTPQQPTSTSGAQSNSSSAALAGAIAGARSGSQSASRSNSGGNKLATGPSTATVGNTTSVAAGGKGGSGGSAHQGQGQQQQQGQSASLAGGNNQAGASNGESVGNGQSTAFNDNSRAIVAPWLPGTPPSVVGSTQSVLDQQTCGPLVVKTREELNGTFHGVLWDSKVRQGYDDDVTSPVDVAGQPRYFDRMEMPDGSVALIGSQIAAFDSVNGTSSARQIGIGTGGSGGGYGQGALGASSANQQQQLRLIVRPCIYAMIPAARPIQVATLVESPREVLKRKIVRHLPVADCKH